MKTCVACGYILSPWEGYCLCTGTHFDNLRDTLYAVACRVQQPIRVADFARLADAELGVKVHLPSAFATLGADNRLCWAGQGMYGLLRHGPIPGPRTLEGATRIVLHLHGRPLTIDAIDFVLRQLKYRFNPISLRSAISRSAYLWWSPDGRVEPWTGDEPFDLDIPPEPSALPDLVRYFQDRIVGALDDRWARLSLNGTRQAYGLEWEPPREGGNV